jgi:hypothetical protein
VLKERIAARTLAWTDIDKFTFLWGYDLVLVYVDVDRGTKKIITDHAPEVLEEIQEWLENEPSLPFNPFEFEGEFGATASGTL